ncbi:MAG TPA: S-layer homology domain-containing protein [Candidatus Flavonifractor intestinipullorum]|uniref:S-layer homology domain-containing protein n=1 Tax=Candidatus Flavonifractor intestinipullorum TaxID=2838587 RepID=A0A9D2MBT6_9FIRM|nr:S-layer homology domain-containing protein [Candidatus Flavonifractor intestinipullorum]
MRNLKRALSMALASVMVLGLMVVGASAAGYEDFTDKSEIVNTEAVSTMVSLGVISGKEDGSYYDPTGSLTRAEACTLIARMLGGGKDPVLGSNIKSTFTDTQGHWAESYIAYCANLGIIVGVGDGSFNPDGTLTGTAAAKMVLCALGYKPEFEGIGGANWELATNTLATKVHLYDGIDTINPSETITRDDVAQLIYNGVQAQEVEYRNLMGQYDGTVYAQPVNGDNEDSSMLAIRFNAIKVEGVVKANEIFGIDGHTATVAGKTYIESTSKEYPSGNYPLAVSNDLVGQRVVIYVRFNNTLSPNPNASTVLGDPIVSDKTTVVETTARLKDADAVKDALKGSGISYRAGAQVETYSAKGVNEDKVEELYTQAPGVRTRFIDNSGDGTVDLVMREVYDLSKVTVYNEKDEKLTLSGIGSVDFADIANYEDVEKDDYVLVIKYDDTYYLTAAETVEGEVTAYNAGEVPTITVDGTKYAVSAGIDRTTDLDGDKLGDLDGMVGDTYRLYLDPAGNVLSALVIDEAIGNYAVITAVNADPEPGFASAQVKLTMADGTNGLYTVNLAASATRWSEDTDVIGSDARELAMAQALADATNGTLVSYSINSDGTVTLGQPSYISEDYAVETGALSGSEDNKLWKNDSSYTVAGTRVNADNSTVFFIQDNNGWNVLVGLNNVRSSGIAAEGDVSVIYDQSNNSSLTAMVLTLDGTYTSTSSYAYISGDYSRTVEDGETVYTYPVVFEDGTTGTIKTKDPDTHAKKAVYSYNTDNDGFATDIAQTSVVNGGYVASVGNGTVTLNNSTEGSYADEIGSYTLASDLTVWNVEDTDSIYDTNMIKYNQVALVLNDDGEVKTAFVFGNMDEDKVLAEINGDGE